MPIQHVGESGSGLIAAADAHGATRRRPGALYAPPTKESPRLFLLRAPHRHPRRGSPRARPFAGRARRLGQRLLVVPRVAEPDKLRLTIAGEQDA